LEPQQIRKQKKTIFEQSKELDDRPRHMVAEQDPNANKNFADPVWLAMPLEALEQTANETKKRMERAAKDLDFMEAARLRDEFFALKDLIDSKGKK
jgi:excinuclease ABC subunit B